MILWGGGSFLAEGAGRGAVGRDRLVRHVGQAHPARRGEGVGFNFWFRVSRWCLPHMRAYLSLQRTFTLQRVMRGANVGGGLNIVWRPMESESERGGGGD